MNTASSSVPVRVIADAPLYGILADPIHHVKTPALFNALLKERSQSGVMLPLHVRPDNFACVLSALAKIENFHGCVVTVPHKTAALQYCDEASDRARLIGAANVLRRVNGLWQADMIDGEGFVAGLLAHGFEPRGRSVYLVGAGGAARAIAFALAHHGVRSLSIFNRSMDRAHDLCERIRFAYPRCELAVAGSRPEGEELIVNATSVGMRRDDPYPFDVEPLATSQTVVEIIMDPAETRLLAYARARGCDTIAGLAMLRGQIESMHDFLTVPMAGGDAMGGGGQ